jgi:predicted anti-sigma-YlaC factor YlaD
MARDCKKMLSELSDYIDDELAEELCEELESHLVDCPNCRVMLDSLTKTVRVYCADKEERLPEALSKKLRAACEKKWDTKNSKTPD